VTDHPIHDLDDDVHQRVRLGILAALTGLTRADFAHLKQELALTDGNLGRHLEVLGEAGFVKLTREAAGSRPRTWISITPSGKRALRKEVTALRKIMSQIDGVEPEEPGHHRSAMDDVANRRPGSPANP
jgi:DNA-binding MarR family transcriptional regulator